MASAISFAIQGFKLVMAAIDAGMAIKDVYDLLAKYDGMSQKMADEKRGPSDEDKAIMDKDSETIRAMRPSLEGE